MAKSSSPPSTKPTPDSLWKHIEDLNGTGEDPVAESRAAAAIMDIVTATKDPNPLNAQGQTPIGIIVRQFKQIRCAADCTIDCLLAFGANPLQYDKALLALAARKTKFLRLVDDHIVKRMAEKEADGNAGLRDADGLNAIQVLAKHNARFLSDILRMSQFNWGRSRKIIEKWSNAVDAEGNTVSHLLWAKGGSIYQFLEKPHSKEDQFKMARCVWMVQEDIDPEGKSLGQANNQGTVVLDLMVDCLRQGFPSLASFRCAEVAGAERNRRDLDIGTPDSRPPVSKRGARL